MNSLFVNSLYIFEYKNKVAKKVNFKSGINIITADKSNGNSVGKSAIIKSIYHALGADSHFSSMWENTPKVYLIDINIKGKQYYVYRKSSLFKIFDSQFKRIFTTQNRNELAIYLADLYEFKIMLPNRKEDKLEIVTPVYSYILNYIDQDKMDGAKFSSFKSLEQYTDYKQKVIYSHLGVYDEEYFEAVKNEEGLKYKILEYESNIKLIKNMINRINIFLNGLNAPDNLEVLNIELDEAKKEYSDIIINLQKIKNNLIEIRNQKLELEINIKEIETFREKEEKKWNKVAEKGGYSNLDLDTKITKSNELEELIIMKDEFEELILECDRKLQKKEFEYKSLLEKLDRYEEKLNINESNVSDILKHKGYLNTKNDLSLELDELNKKLDESEEKLQKYKTIIKAYAYKTRTLKKEYKDLMIKDKQKFNLKEIEEKKFDDIKTYFKADGSNLPIGTIIWHFNLLKLKYKFNKDVIKFPIVLDSPNNAEIDRDKLGELFDYILKNNFKDTQLIVSTLEFNKQDYTDIEFDNIIKLDNNKYELLNKKDYNTYKNILELVLNN